MIGNSALEARSVVGVDLSGLSGSTRGRTWAAELALGQPPRLVSSVRIGRGVAGDRELLDWIVERRPVVVAIDAPLTLPHSIGCEDADCPRCAVGAASYLERDVDALAWMCVPPGRVRRSFGAIPGEARTAAASRGQIGQSYDGWPPVKQGGHFRRSQDP